MVLKAGLDLEKRMLWDELQHSPGWPLSSQPRLCDAQLQYGSSATFLVPLQLQ